MNMLTKSLIAGLLAASLPVYAAEPPKLPLIEHQEKSAETAINDAKAAAPANEGRPAVTVKQLSQNSKELLIQHQKESASKAIKDTVAATPAGEARPTVRSTWSKQGESATKAELIDSQKKAAKQIIQEAEAAKPANESRPAAVTKQL
jgi:hypothetical protein